MRARAFALLVLIAAVAALGPPAHADEIAGVAYAKDGDDVIVQGVDIRLQGIAAPEDNARKREPGGPEATASLAAIVNGKRLRCEPDGTQARGRPVARCFVNGKDVGGLQVAAGHARDCPRFSHGRYATAEAEARTAGNDLSAIYPLPSYCTPR